MGKSAKSKPDLKQAQRKKEYLITAKDTPFAVTEAFRRLLANIGFAIPRREGKGKVFCVSSAIPGEGKSTVAINLAVTSASLGAKTVIVDCDMRKPHIKGFFALKGRGLVDYLSGVAEFEDILVGGVLPSLDVVPCIKTAPNPIALFTDGAFDALIKRLAEEYDMVIIDSPPISVVADVCFVGPKTDGVVLVVRQMHSDYKTIRQAMASLRMSGCNLLGFALNGFAMQKSNRYGYYRHYGRYGY